MNHTDEQLEIIEASRTSKSLVVNALAGTGKTSTALACAKANSQADIVYLCFNKANADEMGRKCLKMGIRNVHPSTLHAMAYRASARPLLTSGRKVGSIKPFQLENVCKFTDMKGRIVTDSQHLNRARKLILENLSDYCHSAAKSFKEFTKLPMFKPRVWQLENLDINIGLFQRETEKLWSLFVEDSRFDLPHDVYLKLFHLDLDDHIEAMRHGMVIVDEAQDLFPVTEDIVKRMRDSGMRAIFLGDRYQQIYSWNKSVNAMEHFEDGSDLLMLTQSFRCPANVIAAAQPWLGLLGFPGVFRPAPEKEIEINDSVVISRSNAGVFGAVSEMLENGTRPSEISFVGGAKGYTFDILEDRLHFVQNRKDLIRFPPMAKMKDEDEYDEYAEATKDMEMQQAKYYVALLGPEKTGQFLSLVKRGAFQENKAMAAISVSTGHKIKGLEFANVTIADSFKDILEEYVAFLEGQKKKIRGSAGTMAGDDFMNERERAELGKPGSFKLDAEELRLAYVAITRSLKNIYPGNLDLSGGRYETIVDLIANGKIVLVDKDQQGNLRLYGQTEKKKAAKKPERKQRRRFKDE